MLGRVVTDAGAPVRGARVAFTNQADRVWLFTTDDTGNFDARVPPGKYRVRASKAGFVDVAQGDEWPELKPGETQKRHDIVMRPGGAIVGRIADAAGDPVQGVQVRAFRVSFDPGNRYLTPTAVATTDDRGQYRLFGLESGTYCVSAGRAGMTPTFHPSTIREHEAQLIRIGLGEERSGTDVVLQAVPLARISGRVQDSKGRQVSAFIWLGHVRHDGAATINHSVAVTDSAGAFSIGNLSPGKYQLHVVSTAVVDAVRQSGTAVVEDAAYESATVPVTVDRDVSDLVVRMSYGFEIRGRVTIDGALSPAGLSSGMMIRAGPILATYLKGGPAAPMTSRIEPDGSFILRGAMGRNVIRVASQAQLVRVTLFGADVTDEGFDVTGPLNGLEIVLSTKRTTVTGTIKDPKGDLVSASVVIFAEDARQWTMPNSRFARTMPRTRPEGFEIKGLPAGRYLAVALADFDEYTWADPENLAQLRPFATAFTLLEGGSATVNLVRR